MYSELRQDLVSGDWIVIAPDRAKRPHQLITKVPKRKKTPLKECPFEDLQKSGNQEPILRYDDKRGNWIIQIIENKYPAFIYKNINAQFRKIGPYSVVEGIGHHDLLITRDHYKNFAHLDKKVAFLVFQALRERYRMICQNSCINYVSIFHNWGPKAGASVFHPHYQIIAVPVVPPDVKYSLLGSISFFKKHKKCVHCVMIQYEKRMKNRIVYENKGAIVFAPFVSRKPFELRIFPKKHYSFFEETAERDLALVSQALQQALLKLERKLNDVDYNFFIHTAPIFDKRKYFSYHWHIEVYPQLSISAGFELSTGIEINVVDPDEAAQILNA
jgi:UDPglucose--hexose-1-phosphate uridylyltransferase